MTLAITLDREKCVRCGSCGPICPMRIFHQVDDAGYPVIADYAEEGCIACGHCVTICPTGSITVGDLTREGSEETGADRLPSFETFADLVKYRRSIRHFKSEKVRREDLDRLFEILRWAPTAKNGLPLHWVVVNGPERVRRLAEIAIDEFRGDPAMSLIVEAWDREGYDWVFRGAPCLIFAYTQTLNEWTPYDTSIGAEILDLAAPTLGLGTCWAGFFIRVVSKSAALRKELGLDPENAVGGALMVGYPDREIYGRIPNRPECSVKVID